MKDLDIAKGWIDRENCEDDPDDKFISAYIALNFLYEGLDFNRSSEQTKKRNEREKMSLYMSKCCQELSIDPFDATGCVSEYLKSPVIDERLGHDAKKWSTQKGDNGALFNAIYQVRCNLFHGNKLLSDERNQKLVEEGAAVILKVLNALYPRIENL
jgi:hypothetical protein